MSNAQPAASVPSFTPSELVVLFGDRFTEKGGMLSSNEEVLTSGVKVSAGKLAPLAMLAGTLAAEKAGNVKLEVRKGKALFGLLKTEKLVVIPGGAPSAWPQGTLEAAVAAGAASEAKVDDLWQAIIAERTQDADARLLQMVKIGLAGRDLLEVEEKKMLKVFTTIKFVLPPATRAAAERESTEPVKDLLRVAEQGRPDIYKRLDSGIRSALAWMTQNDNT